MAPVSESVAMTLESSLCDAERGMWPGADGSIVAVPAVSGAVGAVFAFTAHVFVAVDGLGQEDLDAAIPDGDLSAPLNPPFLSRLEARTGALVNNVDAVLLAPASPAAGIPSWLIETDAPDHPRVRRSVRHRTQTRVFGCDGGLVLVGRGLAGRMEMAFEVDPAYQGGGLGRRLAAASLGIAAEVDESCTHVWAQCAPGNAASMRTLLAAGFAPVGAEALLFGR
jgi:GNAT superfamily N-acetyltransferase